MRRLSGLATRVLHLAPPPGQGEEGGDWWRDPRTLALARALRLRSLPDAPAPFVWAVKGTSRLEPLREASEDVKRKEMEERNRLLYVAMTRAKDHLHLMLPQQFHVHQQAAFGDRHVYASRTRFIPNSATRYFEACAWPVAAAGSGGREPCDRDSKTPVDISARVRQLWR